MTTITLEVPDELNASLEIESARRHVSKSELVVAAIQLVVKGEQHQATAASRWLEEWGGALASMDVSPEGDSRLERILAKHLK